MEPREFSYGGTLVPRSLFAIGSASSLLLAAAGGWLLVNGIDAHARTQGLISLVAFLALFAAGCLSPLFIRWALIVRLDEWGVSLPARARAEKKNGLPWEQISDVRLVAGKTRSVVILVPHNPAYLSPLMRRFGFFVLPAVNVPAEQLKDAIDEYRSRVQQR